MSHTLFLKIALPVIAIPALIVLFLPAGVWPTYVDVVEPLSLLIGSFLALYVSFIYSKQLRAAFIFLSGFLLIYALAIVLFLSFSPIMVPYLNTHLGEAETSRLVVGIQFINYAMLLFFCINLLRVVNVTQLNRNGWTILGITCIFCFFVAIYPVFDMIKDISNLELLGFFHIARRILDAALMIVLAPVLWLYVQYLKSRHSQSLTFTVIIFGIICSTILDYLFQSIIKLFPELLAKGSPLHITIPEMLFIYGYLIIAVGLYAHRKQDKWGYNAVDKAMAGELELMDVG